MVYSLLFILFFEVLFSNGLIQNNGQYIKHFNSCMLPLKIIDDNGENIYTSQMFDEQSYYLLDNDKKLFTSMPILGGKIIIEEDISKLKELQNKLDKSIDELSQANEILMKRTSIENESIRLKIREQLYNEIDVEIAKKSKEIGDLVSLLPDEVNYANRNNAIDILSKIRLRIGYLKQKSLLILQSKIDNKVSNGDFNLFLNVITHDIKNLGFSSLVYTLKGKKNVPVQFALAINELMEYVGEYFANLNSYAFITCNINELKCSVRIETNEKITLPSNFKNPFIKKIGYDFKKKKSQNEYLLVVERGQ